MHITSMLGGLGRNDVRMVRRDSFLRWVIAMPFVEALLVRWGVPALEGQLAGGFSLAPYYPLIISYIVLQMVPLLMGVVIGFLLLDERDENTLQALLVSPLPLRLYLGYRVAAPLLLSVIMIMLAVPLTGLNLVAPLPLLAVALVTAMFAPVVGLFFVAFAENKIQGFAQMKIIGTLALLPVGAYFVAEPWQYLAGLLLPSYWPLKAYWLAAAGEANWLVFLLVGIVVNLVLLAFFVGRFDRVVHR